MTRTGILALVVLLTSTLTACGPLDHGVGAHGGEAASCAAPAISVRPFRVRPVSGPVHVRAGQVLTIYGRFFASDCHDTGQGGPDTAIPHLQLAFAGRYRVLPLATVHPHGPDSSFRVAVRIPPTAASGRARIFETASNHELRLVVSR